MTPSLSAFLLVCVFVNVNCHIGIQPCHSSDSVCLKSSAQQAVPFVAAGIPEYGMQTLDPMEVDHVAAIQQGLSIDFRNTVVKGLRHCLVLDLTRNGDRTSIELQCSVVLVGDYTLKGKLMEFPIEGDGKYKIVIHDIVVKVLLDTSVRSEGGEQFWKVRHWSHTADVRTNVIFHFENLLSGNKRLAQTVTRFANSNWRDIFEEMSPPILKAIVAKIVNETSKLFENVPIRQLSLD